MKALISTAAGMATIVVVLIVGSLPGWAVCRLMCALTGAESEGYVSDALRGWLVILLGTALIGLAYVLGQHLTTSP